MPPVDALVEAVLAPLEAMAVALELLQEFNPSHDESVSLLLELIEPNPSDAS